MRGPAPVCRRRILVTQIDPERKVPRLRRCATQQAAHRQAQAGRQVAADDRELVRKGGPATAGARKREAVGRADRSGRRQVTLVREPERPRGGRQDECDRSRGQEDRDSALHQVDPSR